MARFWGGESLRPQTLICCCSGRQVNACLKFYDDVIALAKKIGDLPLEALALKVGVIGVRFDI